MAAAADRLRSDLLSLRSCVSSSDAPRARELVGSEVGQICLNEISARNADFCLSLLFDREFGVAAFLRSTVDRDEFQESKLNILELLQSLVIRYGRALVPYAVDIKVSCASLFFRDKASKVKNAVVPLLIELLRVCNGLDVCKDLEVKTLIEKFMMELTKPVSKHLATVKGNLYHILGVFAELFPELMVGYSEKILETYVTCLKTEMTSKTKKPEMSIIAGCLQGLTSLLLNFTHSAEEGGRHSFDIYKFARMALDVNIKHTRYDVPRAALQLFSKHACQFGKYLMDEYEKIYVTLSFWSSHYNREMLHAGTAAFEAALKQISLLLVANAKKRTGEVEIFKFFIQKFRGIMNDLSASSKQISLAIRGYGLLSAPCRIFLSADDVRFMYMEIMQKCEQIYFGQSGGLEDRLMSLPSFLEAFSCIVAELDQISESFLSSLERLVVLMIENFPRLNRKVHFVCFLSIFRIYFALGRQGIVCHGFLSRTIYQGLIRTCSHPVVIESTEKSPDVETYNDEAAEVSSSKLSYKDYLDFWNALLDVATMKELSQLGLSLEERDVLSREIYDELLTSILKVISRLNLSSAKSSSVESAETENEVFGEEFLASSDPVLGLNATRPSDFVIFINLVDFCREILLSKRMDLFQCWVYKFGREVIICSTRNPLVSGLYKLLTVCFQICRKIAYFQNFSSNELQTSKKESVDSMDVDVKEISTVDSEIKEQRTSLTLFSKFIEEISVQARCYRDDLLCSCLILILAVPDEILVDHLDTAANALQKALLIGRSYLPLAKIALSTLEHWCHALPCTLMEVRYKDILPLLDVYMKSAEGPVSEFTFVGKSTSCKRIGKKISLKIKAAHSNTSEKATEQNTELATVRNQCIRLLGQLGGSINNLLVTQSLKQKSKTAVAWDTEKHLKFNVPFIDLKPTIYFDPFLPRVVELATTSSDRGTKVTACELLHSLVLYMVGRGAAQLADEKCHSMAPLFKKIFPAIMQLACDVEQVSRQLFEPLMLQLIHWFTGHKISQSQETLTLLDSIMEGIVSSEDSALRDFSALCLREFVKWTIKQSTKKEIEVSPFSVKAVLKRFSSLARHPNAFKRLGAALGFNSIYAVFREEESLVDMFVFELLVTFIESLALAHSDDKALGTQAQCRLAVEHLERIVKVKSSLLSKSSKVRRKPKNWADGDLNSMLDWLLLQCGRPQTECRHLSMELVYRLSTSVPGLKTPKDFFNSHLKKTGAKYFIERFEKESYKLSKGGKCEAGDVHRADVSESEFSLKFAVHWFELILASLDCYAWVIGQDLLDPVVIFEGRNGSVLFDTLKNFVKKFAFGNLEDLLGCKRESAAITPREIEKFNKSKCTVIVRLLGFLSSLFGRHGHLIEKILPNEFLSVGVWRLVVACIVNPIKVGFNLADIEVMTKLPEETSELLKNLHRAVVPCSDFQTVLAEHLKPKKMFDLRAKLPDLFLSENSTNRVLFRYQIRSFGWLNSTGYLKNVDVIEISNDFIEHMFQLVVKKAKDGRLLLRHLSPLEVDLAVDCLNLGFALKTDPSKVMELILNKTPVARSASCEDSTSGHGDLFYATFKSVIVDNLLTIVGESVPLLASFSAEEKRLVGTVLSDLLDSVTRNATIRHKIGDKLIDALLGQWSLLKVWWEGDAASTESKSLALALLTKAIVISSSNVTNVNSGSFPDVFAMYCGFLVDKNLPMAVKIQALDLLMFFVVLPEPYLTKVKNTLNCFVADNFPMKSSEFPVGSSKCMDYTSALDKILVALELSGSAVILELVISILCREKHHFHEEVIERSLVKTIKRLRGDNQKPCIDVAYRIFLQEGSLTNEQRCSVLEKVCLPLLRASQTSTLIEFFCNHIREILAALEAKEVKGLDSAVEWQLTTWVGCFLLVELMYSSLLKENVHSSNSQINAVYASNKIERTGKEMTTALTKLANAVKSEDVRGESKHLDLRRRLHCAAYNALIAVISRTQTDVKFYNGFLFAENPSKGQFLWENLIDPAKKYEFPIEMEAPMARQRKYASIRSENLQMRRQQMEDGEDESVDRFASVHYFTSQYLSESSLNADVSQFDFSGAVMSLSRSASFSASEITSVREKVTKHAKTASSSLDSSEDRGVNEFIELEMDSLNLHESMAPLTALISHLNQVIKIDKDSKEMPIWMNSLHQKFSSDCHLNVKLFIVKMILNSAEAFRQFARFWISPLIRLVTETTLGESGINYMVNDIAVLILSWHTIYKPQANDSSEKSLVSNLLRFLMKHCHHDNRQVLRNNLEVLKTLVEVWRDSIDVQTKIIYENFSEADPRSIRNSTGVQMVGVVVANGLLPFQSNQGIDRDSFYKMLALNMTNEQKIVYAAAAEVVGMTLKLLSESNSDRDWFSVYVDNVSSMLLRMVDEKKKIGNFITCAYRIQLHYPLISDRFLSKILYLLPNVFGIFKAHCLEIIHNRIDHIPNIFLELKSKGFVELLSQRDGSTQQVSLKVVHGMLRHLKSNELQNLLPSVSSFTSSLSAQCRLAMYDIFIWIYDNYRGESGDETSDQILTKAKETLLQGLSDDSEQNRLHVHNFWTNELHLPTGTMNRLAAVLEAMYSPDMEDQYLRYATNFMMELTSKSPDFNREIFDRPLSECKFQDYRIQSSWQQRHSAMTPLFVETQFASQTLHPHFQSVVGKDESSLATRQLRMTQDVNSFAPTVSHGPYNWLTQNSLEPNSSFAMDSSSDDDFGKSLGQSSLLFTIGRSSGFSAKKLQLKPVGANFGKDRLGKKVKQDDDGNDGSLNEILNLRRRFVKSHQEESNYIFFAKRQTRINLQRERIQQEQRLRREHHVTIYRNYRIGDLPDIQIKYSHIIAPLQGLAQKDDSVAKLLFSSLFQSVFDEIENERTEKEADELVQKMNQALNEMLRCSSLFFAPFLSFILDVSLRCSKKINLEPGLIRMCCISGNIQPLGILLLEESVSQFVGRLEQPRTKRARDSSLPTDAPQNADAWIELGRIYKSVGEFDVVTGIFGSKLGTITDLTKNAIEAEMKKDFQMAAKLYTQGLCTRNEEMNELEIDFWEENRLRCYDHLCQWEKLEDACHRHLDIDLSADEKGLDVVWENEIYQETFLPSLIRSKLKLLLNSQPQQTFLNFLDRANGIQERKAFLELNHCEELALLYMWQDDYERSSHYASMAVQMFFQDWSSLKDQLAFCQLAKLQSLQKLVELQEFLLIVKRQGNLQKLSSAKNLMTDWAKRHPDCLLDPPSIWDDVTLSRCVFIDHLLHELKPVAETDRDIFERSKTLFRIQQIDSAWKQNNFNLALRLLKSTRSEALDWCNARNDVKPYLLWTEAYVRTHHQRIKQLTTLEASEKLKALNGTKDLLDKCSEKWAFSPLLLQRQSLLLAETTHLTADVLSRYWLKDFNSTSDEIRSMLSLIAGCKASAADEVLTSLIEKSYQLGQRAAVCVMPEAALKREKTEPGPEDDLTEVRKAHLSLFHFCNHFLQQVDADPGHFSQSVPSFHEFPSSAVKSLLSALKLNSYEARVFFPRLLQIVAAYPDTVTTFVQCASEVPVWMFLGWISQMTAILDRPEAIAVHQILIEIAHLYPEALIYPFKLSSENFKLDESLSDAKNTATIKRLKEILSKNRLIEKLIVELEQLDQPNIIFKDWMNEFATLLSRSGASSLNRRHLYEEMYVKLVGQKGSSAELYDGGSTSLEVGPYWKNFHKKFASEVEKLCGHNGKNLEKISFKEFCEKAKKLSDEMNAACEANLRPPLTVREYSPWLAEFQGNLYDEEIEIPGQYTGMRKPMPEFHTKVSGFQETVLVMASLRRPKRIIIRGNDEKDYKFLVKCGEDLRQDQRIEILFGIMNDIFDRSATCRQMSLHIQTYQVIPMTSRLGMLEWMDHTVPLKKFIEDMMTNKDHIISAAKEDHFKVIGGSSPKDYMTSYKRLSRSEAVTAFRRRENLVPSDLLRRAYMRMSASLEAFYGLRTNFGRTHSQICICHYLLGIGDRHQSNYMIDLETGAMVGIDFGHAFGSATQFLPVPELVPFRLTRQILNVMRPLKEKGLMEGVMIHTLRALRENSSILLSTMDVFIKEPSLDWKINAEKQKKQMAGDEVTKLDESWYPRQKIGFAQRKLSGDNCVHIMRDELRLGHGKASYFRDLELVLLGDASKDVRARHPEHDLSVEQQVAGLIDLATDPNILGRFWIGWEPWM